MIYSFSDTIFENFNEVRWGLLDIIWSTSKGRHFLFIDSNQNFNAIKQSEWYKHLRKSNQEQIDLQFVASAQLNKKHNNIIISQGVDDTFTLDEASHFLNQPVSIVLENSLNDAYFVKAIIYHFDNLGTLKKHLDNRWIQFENMGGCTNMENFLNAKLSSFETLPKEPYHYLRCFVLLDSDRISPQKKKEHKHGNNIHFLKKSKIPYHILEKINVINS